MSLLDKLKSLFGLGSSPRRPTGQRDVGVTVEHEPDETRPSVESERAVKGADVTDGTGRRTDADGTTTTDGPTETGERGEDESTVEIPDAEDESGAREPAEDQVEIPDAEELADADEAEEETTPDEPAPEPEAAGESTEEIKGIGSTYADRLAEAGVETVGDLAAADPAELAAEADVPESRLERWVQRARDR